MNTASDSLDVLFFNLIAHTKKKGLDFSSPF